MGRISDELLIKAKRDISKLVKVQRMVTRGGKTFPQDVYVLPSQVKATDKVIGNQQNLLPQMGSVPKPAAGVLDAKYFDSIKSDRTKALDYLKSCGIQWTVSGHAGVDWMRAMQAYKAAAGIQNTTQAASSTAAQSNSQQTVSTAQSAQNTQSGGVTLTAAQQAQVDAGKNGKEKVVILKKILGAYGCLAYAKQLGITWDEIGHTAINNMRMTVALKAHFDAVDGTVSPTGKDAGAPKGNQNAKKDDVQPAPPSDKLEIPVNATERQKNMINLINNIDDVQQLELIQKSGFIPEDSVAHDFVEKKLWKAYDEVEKLSKRHATTQTMGRSYYVDGKDKGFGTALSELTTKIFKGLPKKLIKQAAGGTDLTSHNTMCQLVNPGRGITIFHNVSPEVGGGSYFSNNTFTRMLYMFSELSAYDSDDTSCMGYWGKDAAERSSRYNKDKEGFVRLLNHIGKNQPELKAESEKMAQEYDELMQLCGKNYETLNTVLNTDFIAISERCKTYKSEEEAIQVVKKHLESLGFTPTEIDATLSNTEWGALDWTGSLKIKESKTAGYGVYKKDANGKNIHVELGGLVLPNGVEIVNYLTSNTSGSRKLDEIYTGLKNVYAEEITEDQYNKIIDKACKLFGTKIVNKTTLSDPDLPHSQRGYSDNCRLTYVPDISDERSAIMMNLSYAHQGLRLRTNIDQNIYMCPASAANQNGNDMTGNYTWYSPNMGGSYPKRRFKSKSEEIAQVDHQISQIKTYSMEYQKQLKSYVEHEGNPLFKKGTWDEYSDSFDAKVASTSLGASKLTSASFTTESNPAVDILVDQLVDAAMYCPQNFGVRVNSPEKLSVDVRKKLGHQAYTFKDYTTGGQLASDVKSMRERALSAAHCSLASVDAQKRQEVEHEVKINFDRVDSNGKRVPKAQRVYDDRTLVFHSGVFEVKNHSNTEAFEAEAKRLNETPQHRYHGTSYGGACGIVGVDGQWKFERDNMSASQKKSVSGAMLGEGIYMAKMVGKNCPYIGRTKYSYSRHTAAKQDTDGEADGILIVCDTLFGKYGEFNDSSTAQRNNCNSGGSYDSVAVGAGAMMPGGSAVKEYECVVARNNMVLPKYLVDCGARRR